MKKNVKNFLLLTLVVSVVATLTLAFIEYLVGPVALFFGAVISVVLGFIYVVYMQIRYRGERKRHKERIEHLHKIHPKRYYGNYDTQSLIDTQPLID